MSDVTIVQKGTFEVIRSAVSKAVDLIKPTYGPAANKVIISKVLNKMVVDDGVQIARDLELSDPLEEAVWKKAKEVAISTNDRAGDGTTGSLIMLQAIIEEVARLPKFDGHTIARELKNGLEEAKAQLLASARKVDNQSDLRKVARISFDHPTIADIIANTWHMIGKDGVIAIDKSGTMDTRAELSDGIKLDRGYVSPYMITHPQRMEAVIEKPYILVTDYRLTEINDILPVMEGLVKKQITNLVVICENIEQNALATAIVNKMQGKFNLIAINMPSGETIMDDIALVTGAKLFSQKRGDKLEAATIADLGRAERFVCKRTESIVVGPKGDAAAIKKAKDDLAVIMKEAPTEKEKEQHRKRLAWFSNKIAVIKVGAPTESEVNVLKYKVEDAVNAVKSAYQGGVVCGAGLALSRLSTSSSVLNAALKAPFEQLKRNMGIGNHRTLKSGEALNAMTGEIGPFMEVGVVDPVEVLIAGIESAVSIAGLLVTTTGMIVEKPKEIPSE